MTEKTPPRIPLTDTGVPEVSPCPRCRTRYRTAGMAPNVKIRCGECGEVFVPGAAAILNPVVAAEHSGDAPKHPEHIKNKVQPFGFQPTVLQSPAPDRFRTPLPVAAPMESGKGAPPILPQTVEDVLRVASGQDKYIDHEEVARGGMGVIFKAYNRAMRRDVALKVMKNEATALQRSRFVEEAQITAQLEHPNIVPVHELGIDRNGRMFFAMKMVKGRSLADILDELRAHPNRSDRDHSLGYLITVFLSVCNAMAFAHDKGVVHRDLKPANIMLGSFGEVLVMDWGLAKVGAAQSGQQQSANADDQDVDAEPAAMPAPMPTAVSSFRYDSEAEHTIEGAIAGTPVYMSPEQARGNIALIDARSDIYALGGILYEILTLSPPIRGKNVEDILAKVRAGKIRAIEQATPTRPVPKELAAIAMKALAGSRSQRYQTVEALIADIERHLEGHSVSAKDDSAWETLVRLIKRQRTAAIAAAAALIAIIAVSIGGYAINAQERARAEQLLAGKEASEQQRHEEQRRSAPAWIAKARRGIEHKDFEDAKVDVDLALGFDPEQSAGYYLRAQLLIREQDYPNALSALKKYLSFVPGDKSALELMTLCTQAHTTSSEVARTFADAFLGQGNTSFAEAMMDSSEGLLKVYRSRLDQTWPGSGAGLMMENDGTCALSLTNRDLGDLSALKDIPLSSIDLTGSKLIDLMPLQGKPLTKARLSGTRIRDIMPLAGMPLQSLSIANTEVRDLGPIAGRPLKSLDIAGSRVRSLTPLKGMPLQSLSIAGTQIDDLSVLKGMPLQSLNIDRTPITDLSMLKGLPLRSLSLADTGVSDLEPLRNMPLSELSLSNSKVHDVSALQGMALTHLFIDSTAISDLTCLLGLPLVELDISNTKVTHLAAVAGMPLERLAMRKTLVRDLSPIKGQRLNVLNIDRSPISDLSPIKGQPLSWITLFATNIEDLTPLKGMSLERITLPHAPPVKGLDVLRAMTGLIEISNDGATHTPSAAFWKTQIK